MIEGVGRFPEFREEPNLYDLIFQNSCLFFIPF